MSSISSDFPPNPFAVVERRPLFFEKIVRFEQFEKECRTLSRDQILLSLYIFYFSDQKDAFFRALIHVGKALMSREIAPKSFCSNIGWAYCISNCSSQERSSLATYFKILQSDFQRQPRCYRIDEWYAPCFYTFTPFHAWHGLCFWLSQAITWTPEIKTELNNAAVKWIQEACPSVQEIVEATSLIDYFQLLIKPLEVRDLAVAEALEVAHVDYIMSTIQALDLAAWQQRAGSQELLLHLLHGLKSSEDLHEILSESVRRAHPNESLEALSWVTRCDARYVEPLRQMIVQAPESRAYVQQLLTAIVQAKSIPLDQQLSLLALGCDRFTTCSGHIVDVVNLLQEVSQLYLHISEDKRPEYAQRFKAIYIKIWQVKIDFDREHVQFLDCKSVRKTTVHDVQDVAKRYKELCELFGGSFGLPSIMLCTASVQLVSVFVSYSTRLAKEYSQNPALLAEKNLVVADAVGQYRQILDGRCKQVAFQVLLKLIDANCTQSSQEIRVSLSDQGKLQFSKVRDL